MTTKLILTLAAVLSVSVTVFAAPSPATPTDQSTYGQELGRGYRAARGAEGCNDTARGSFNESQQQVIHPANYLRLKENAIATGGASGQTI